jgi:Cu2+-containing amine oxidase
MELKLNLSEILVRLGLDDKLIGYVKAVCYFNRRIDREISGNKNLVLRWKVSGSQNSKAEMKKKEKNIQNLDETLNEMEIDEEVYWPSIVNGDILENRKHVNALEYCFMKGKNKKDTFDLLNKCHYLT